MKKRSRKGRCQLKLYHYTCHDVHFEDIGHVVAETLEQAEEMAQEIFEDGDYLAVFVQEVEVKGYEIKVNKIKGED